MSQTKITRKDYTAGSPMYICNGSVEWLMEHGKIRDCIFFKGAIGDRYTTYIFSKRNKNIIDINSVYNTYSYDSSSGTHIGTLDKNYVLKLMKGGNTWYEAAGYTLKQLLRQGVCPKDDLNYSIRYCRSAYFVKLHDGTEFTPWLGMKINIRTGELVNKPSRASKAEYNKAKNTDKDQRKRNYIANRENRKALERYRKAGGNTEFARRSWMTEKERVDNEKNMENIDWSLIPISDVFRHRNATLRSNIIEHYGMEAIVDTLEYEVVDEEVIGGRPYKLLDVTIPDYSDASPGFNGSYKGLHLQMINPSTGETHIEPVPNAGAPNSWGTFLGEAKVRAALAWRDQDLEVKSGKTWGTNFHPMASDYVEPIILK